MTLVILRKRSKDRMIGPKWSTFFGRCTSDKYLEYEYKKSASQSFSFLGFRFKSGYQDVYIHCKLTVCRSDNQESKCEKGCKKGENESRKKRDVKEGYQVDVFVGPVKLKEDEGKGNYRKKILNF